MENSAATKKKLPAIRTTIRASRTSIGTGLPGGRPRHTVGRGRAAARAAATPQPVSSWKPHRWWPPQPGCATAIAVIASLDEQLTRGEAALTIAFTAHPDAVIVQSQPGLGMMRRRKVKWCCSRCHEASSLAISGNSHRPPGQAGAVAAHPGGLGHQHVPRCA